jgi:hypothetical protein
MILKEDMEEAKDRMEKWWNKEPTDRPVLSYSYARPDVIDFVNLDSWHLGKNNDDIKGYCDIFETHIKQMVWGGEKIPSLFINYGPGIMAAVLGVTPEFRKRTVWFDKPTDIKEIVDVLEQAKINQNNEWYNRLIRVTEYAANRSQKSGLNYSVSTTDIGGVLDILSSFLKPTRIILAMKRNPEIIDTCRSIILEKTLKVYDDLVNIQKKYNLGINAWLDVWCPKTWYPMQCDFAYMLSPKYFKRFALPDLIEQAEHMDYSIYHLDGEPQLAHLDDLLEIEALTGIQWVPGTQGGNMSDEKWIPVYNKIQKGGKNIVMSVAGTEFAEMYRRYEKKGLFVRSHLGSQIMAEFCLPEFMGGMGGIDDEDDD